MIGLPSFHGSFRPVQNYLQSGAIWSYAIASSAGFLFFGMK